MRRLPPSVRVLFIGVVMSRLILTLVGVSVRDGQILSSPPSTFAAQPVSSHQWLNAWIAWDAGWYAQIASHGYPAHPTTVAEKNTYAFSPLFPWLVGVVSRLTGHVYLVGLIWSNLALLVWITLLWWYGHHELGARRAQEAVGFMLLLPAGFIFSA